MQYMADPLLHPHRALLDEELSRLRDIVSDMGELVDGQITRAMQGLIERDLQLCGRVIAERPRLTAPQRDRREIACTRTPSQRPVARSLRQTMGRRYMSR